MKNPKKKIIYITGLGRSGSTLLSMVLGTHPNGISLGEVSKVIRYRGTAFDQERLDKRICSCGASANECQFWGPFIRWLKNNHEISFGEKYEEFFKYFWKNYPEDIFLVDSSKERPGFLKQVHQVYDIRVLHLVRDIHGYVNSSMRVNDQKASGCIVRWIIGNWRRRKIISNFEQSISFGFDEICFEPEMMLKKLSDQLGINYDSAMLSPVGDKGHILHGNLVSQDKEKSAKIRYDYRWLVNPSTPLILRAAALFTHSINHRWVYENLQNSIEDSVFSDKRRNQIRKKVR